MFSHSAYFFDNQVDGYHGKTGLHLVAESRYCNKRIAKKLLEMGCGITKGDYQGKKPIHIAIATNSLDMLTFLYREKEDDHNRVRHDSDRQYEIIFYGKAYIFWDII